MCSGEIETIEVHLRNDSVVSKSYSKAVGFGFVSFNFLSRINYKKYKDNRECKGYLPKQKNQATIYIGYYNYNDNYI